MVINQTRKIKSGQVVRYCVRPKNTISGWYVWAVLADETGKETYAILPHSTHNTKRGAQAVKDSLNTKLSVKIRPTSN